MERPSLPANAPRAAGPYSHAIRYGGLLFISGQVGLDPSTEQLVPGGVVAEISQALSNLSVILKASGSRMDRLVKTTIFLVDMSDYAKVNEVYQNHFSGEYPARSCVEVKGLPLGARVEIEAIAEA